MLATIVAIAVLAFILQRVYFHPLSKIPGPKLAALTSFYYTFHEFRGDRHFFIDKLHRKYGAIVRIGPSYVSCSDPAAVKEIYGVGSWDPGGDGIRISVHMERRICLVRGRGRNIYDGKRLVRWSMR